jgi:hypothetical protein
VRIKNPESPHYERIPGEDVSIFFRDGDYHLARLRVFADGVIELGRIASPQTLDLDGLRRAVKARRVSARAPAGARIHIHGLGSFRAASSHSFARIGQIVREIPDLIDKANGRPDSVARCRAAYEAYVAEPTVARRDALRVAYEAVPEHNRMYVGDMDTKDVAVRMILYGKDQIEQWSHRAVARAMGEKELPDIHVPEPRDERPASRARPGRTRRRAR